MNLPTATTPSHDITTPASCRVSCALEVVDSLLRATGTVQGAEVDALLDLRFLLRQRQDAEAALALFCQLRRAMEARHYLAFYRLRRWLENQIQFSIRLRRSDPERTAALKLDRFCLEAVRCLCLQSVLGPGAPFLAPKVRFFFRPAEQPMVSTPAGCAGC